MTTSWKLFLDDIRDPHQVSDQYVGFTIARTYDEAIALMKRDGCPSFIAFDHDLHPDHYAPTNPLYQKPSEAGTGYDVAKWMVYKDLAMMGKFIPDDFSFSVHSMNPVGKENIIKFLDSYLDFRREERCRKSCSL